MAALAATKEPVWYISVITKLSKNSWISIWYPAASAPAGKSVIPVKPAFEKIGAKDSVLVRATIGKIAAVVEKKSPLSACVWVSSLHVI